ncbi:MAG: aspartate aminotransferase family protein [Chloroflexi bacterium]|nr:aspartate aminotransferase family protein [Chloroflexota bacterium]
MNTAEIQALDSQYVAHTYARAPFVIERGEGVYVCDTDGKRYIDCVAGIAVNALGYGDADVRAAVADQMARLTHISNLYTSLPQAQLAKMLVERSFADKVFFCNSGTEAMEAAIKFARKWARARGQTDKTEFVAFSHAFHGRTMGALALTPRSYYQDAFKPLMPGVSIAEYNDLGSAAALVNERTCAVVVEPLQGEGGVHPAEPAFLQGLRALCTRANALLIFDEVQCGLARTGTLWAHEPYGATPDLMALAKPLGGGLPMGATLMTEAVADCLAPGDHASTFGANPAICAAAQIVLSKLSAPEFLAHVREMGAFLQQALAGLQSKHRTIRAVRGRGLIWGIEADRDVAPIIEEGYRQGLITCKAGANVVRLVPPLVIRQAELSEVVAILDRAFGLLED